MALLALASWGMSAQQPIVAGGSRNGVVLPLPYRVATAPASWEQEMTALNLLNRERVVAGLLPLMPHAGIRTVARSHGVELFSRGYLSHRSPDGRWPDQRVKERGIRVRAVGENLAYASNVRAAHSALVASPPHRVNLLLPRYRLVGIAVIDGGPHGVIVVQIFGD